ncbi:hypothetical protein [Pengzhenrongella sp.]|uniref:hypothetical protein n=1 Tax=Pengzhenrongella sp. TaxID=2888820 RepID=UPI002F93E59F
MVTRAPSVDDERGTTVTITEQGRDTLTNVFPGHIAVLDELLFEPLTRGDVEALAEVLGRLRDHMRSAPPRSAARRRKASRPTAHCL